MKFNDILKEDYFLVYRKYLTVGQKFFLSDRHGNRIIYGVRDPYKIKSDFHFYLTDDLSDEVLTVYDNSLKDYTVKYLVYSGDEYIGGIKKVATYSSIRHKWLIFNSSDNVAAIASEDNWVKGLFRRFVNIPLLSIILQNNVTVTDLNNQKLAEIYRRFSFFEKFDLRFFPSEENRSFNRMLIVAFLGIMLDISSGR